MKQTMPLKLQCTPRLVLRHRHLQTPQQKLLLQLPWQTQQPVVVAAAPTLVAVGERLAGEPPALVHELPAVNFEPLDLAPEAGLVDSIVGAVSVVAEVAVRLLGRNQLGEASWPSAARKGAAGKWLRQAAAVAAVVLPAELVLGGGGVA
jgi:hypothetical protein